jgi:hypothetical protein
MVDTFPANVVTGFVDNDASMAIFIATNGRKKIVPAIHLRREKKPNEQYFIIHESIKIGIVTILDISSVMKKPHKLFIHRKVRKASSHVAADKREESIV